MLSISRFVHMCVCLSVGLFTFEVTFKCPYAPTARSQMSRILEHLESFGKSNGKKWSQILKLLIIKGVKSQRKNYIVFEQILPH